MTYYQFIQAVETKVKEGIGENVLIGHHTAEKNNGVMKCGIVLAKEGVNISPTIYLEEYFEQFQYGRSLDNIVTDIIRLYHEVRFEKSWDEKNIRTFQAVEEKIIYRIVNFKENESLLEGIPHVPFLDLAITFHVLLEITNFGTATMMIRNEHLQLWDVSTEVLYEKAKANTERLLPYEFQTMSAVMEELTSGEVVMEEEILFVLSNTIRSFGAAAILYENRLERIGEYLGENFYVLPSSVHETIIVPESFAPSREILNEMIREINDTQVSDEEILGNQAYYYERKLKRMLL